MGGAVCKAVIVRQSDDAGLLFHLLALVRRAEPLHTLKRDRFRLVVMIIVAHSMTLRLQAPEGTRAAETGLSAQLNAQQSPAWLIANVSVVSIAFECVYPSLDQNVLGGSETLSCTRRAGCVRPRSRSTGGT